jgi:hypothetical protein
MHTDAPVLSVPVAHRISVAPDAVNKDAFHCIRQAVFIPEDVPDHQIHGSRTDLLLTLVDAGQ